jgi:anthranilate phosphoribosyltransferase
MKIKEKFEKLFEGKMSEEEAREFLISLYQKGESVEDITAAVEVMRNHSIKLPLPLELQERAIDIVGTGGDKSFSFNISTTVALLLASAKRVVAKHGNRSVTSKSGSADVLEALGIELNLDPKSQVKMLEEVGFTFIFAINHHPAMKHIMPIRRSIPHRTIFNILGPLTNPAGAKKYLMGVFSPDYLEKMAQVLKNVGVKRAYVVSSLDGMDEISISSATKFAYTEAGKISLGEIHPNDFGFKTYPKEAILGKDAKTNAKIILDIFDGKEEGAKRDIVVLNSAFALFVDGNVRDILEGIEIAQEMIDSKKAKKHLEKIIQISQKLKS